MIKYCLTLLICCLASALALGQGEIRGRVFENKTRLGLADIQVRNITTTKYTKTDEKGRFVIAAKPGDILTFKGFAYLADTLLLTDLADREVFLLPNQRSLDEVKVTTDSTKNMNTYYDPRFHGQTVIYSHDADLNYTGGLTIRLWDWKKDERKKKKLAEEIKEENEQDEVNRIFQPKNIARFVPLKGEEMDNFLAMYTPTAKVYYKPGFDMTNYLNDCYKKYMQLPPDKRHPDKLTGDAQ